MDIEKLAQSTFNKYRESVVIIVEKGERGMKGTGFIIRSTNTSCLVMTCYHVVQDFVASKGTLCVRFAGEATEYEAEILHKHKRVDIAIVRVRGTKREYQPLQFGDAEDVPPETNVCLLGYIFTEQTVHTLEPAVSPGKTSRPPQVTCSGVKDVVITSAARTGCSGSPVMLGDKVIGVMFCGVVQLLHARSSESINSLLKYWLHIAQDATRSTVEMIDQFEI